MDISTPQGFRDVLFEEAERREEVVRAVQACFADRGYVPVETPTLEVFDVMNGSGVESGAPFKFFDSAGDLLAMRPDVTVQVARMCATRLGGVAEPLRFRYTHRVFREAEGELQATARELKQVGIECIGASGVEADVEVVSLLAESLALAGVKDYTLALATVSPVRALLEASGAPDWWCKRALAALHASDLVELGRLTCAEGLEAVVAEAGLSVAADEIAQICASQHVAAITQLPRIRGGRSAIDAVRALVEPLGCEAGLDEFATLYDALMESDLAGKMLVDFSMMSSFDYYTGMVFAAFSPYVGTPLGSGGRYDKLIGTFGADRPAAGCAFYLERAMAAAAADERAATGAITKAADRPLRIAVPKGSLNADTIRVLQEAGLDTTGLEDPGRQLIISNPGVDYIIVRPTDAPAFVAHGAADCGICGRDSILEADPEVVQLVDLEYGACRFIVAEPAGAAEVTAQHYKQEGSIRVATKYPRIARAHYAKTGTQVEIVKLHGNIELAPLTGMAERIVDITATGTTLRENNLVIVEDVLASTAQFFANVCAYRTDPRCVELADKLMKRGE